MSIKPWIVDNKGKPMLEWRRVLYDEALDWWPARDDTYTAICARCFFSFPRQGGRHSCKYNPFARVRRWYQRGRR
jgi:hypothetical protein